MFQIEQLAKSMVAFRAGTVVDLLSVKASKINRLQQGENFGVEFKGLTRRLPDPLVPEPDSKPC
jgi:hypothetical protein